MGSDKKRALNLILGPKEDEKEAGAEKSALAHCVEEFIHAVHAKDVEAAVEAFRSCFAELEAEEPEEESKEEG